MNTLKTLIIIALLIISSGLYSQSKRTIMSNEKVVTQFLEGFNDIDKLQASMDLLTDNYKFSNPLVSLKSKMEFIPLAQQIAKTLTGVNILQIASSGKWVAVSYEFTTNIPGVESNFATEWFYLEKGQITESKLIYDASEWRKIYAQME